MLRKDSLIPVFDWERDAAASIGQTVSVLRFMLCFFASVPVSIVFKQVPTAKGTIGRSSWRSDPGCLSLHTQGSWLFPQEDTCMQQSLALP